MLWTNACEKKRGKRLFNLWWHSYSGSTLVCGTNGASSILVCHPNLSADIAGQSEDCHSISKYPTVAGGSRHPLTNFCSNISNDRFSTSK